MGNGSALQVLDDRKPRALTRREWIRRMLSGAATGMAIPGLAAAHPVREHLADLATLERADAQAAAGSWKPEFLDSFQAQTLAALAERIIPGAANAHADRFIDTLLSVDKRESQESFVSALSAFEGEATKKFGHSYKDLSETQQNKILTEASKAKSGHGPAGGRRRRRGIPRPPSASNAEEHDTLRDYFENLKGWVVGAYYSSEAGMRELGWTGEVMFESFPGCQHPGGHT